jgi:hypothetical protein
MKEKIDLSNNYFIIKTTIQAFHRTKYGTNDYFKNKFIIDLFGFLKILSSTNIKIFNIF